MAGTTPAAAACWSKTTRLPWPRDTRGKLLLAPRRQVQVSTPPDAPEQPEGEQRAHTAGLSSAPQHTQTAQQRENTEESWVCSDCASTAAVNTADNASENPALQHRPGRHPKGKLQECCALLFGHSLRLSFHPVTQTSRAQTLKA